MSKESTQNSEYDLEERTLKFAKDVRSFVDSLSYSVATKEDSKQLIRASGSVGANYIEANESVSKKDFLHRIKISRKEAKESKYWLKLIDCERQKLQDRRNELIQEAAELMNIFSSIIINSEDDSST